MYKTRQSIQYSTQTLKRAERALRSAPFCLPLFAKMATESVSVRQVAGASGVQHQFTKQSLSEISAESELLWLIQVGLLRREVDGQGLTDSFRLTPLGRQLMQQWQLASSPKMYQATLLDRLYNALSRWFRLPF